MRHPCTQALFRSIPLPGADRNSRPLFAIPGSFPLPHGRPPGCNFGPRCNHFEQGLGGEGDNAMSDVEGNHRHETRCRWKSQVPGNRCKTEVPENQFLASGHHVKCHLGRAELDSMSPVIKIAA